MNYLRIPLGIYLYSAEQALVLDQQIDSTPQAVVSLDKQPSGKRQVLCPCPSFCPVASFSS